MVNAIIAVEANIWVEEQLLPLPKPVLIVLSDTVVMEKRKPDVLPELKEIMVFVPLVENINIQEEPVLLAA